jgi:uncharacterized protein (DUF1778 family)
MKTANMQIRLTQPEKEAFEKAADLSGIALSSWVRERLRRAAIIELREAGLAIPFLEGFGDD